MNTSLDCMPCFMKMAVNEAKLACPNDRSLQYAIVKAWAGVIPCLDLDQPPPAIARHLSRIVRRMSGCGDLYAEDKRSANDWMLSLLPDLRKRLDDVRSQPDGDPLGLALELSIVGNYIDRGIDLEFDVEGEIAALERSLPAASLAEFKEQAQQGRNVLIIGDNCGEIVLDTLLVAELKRRGCEVTYAVRSVPVINDATMEDARCVGMTDLCDVVESGVDTPGTVLERCSQDFLSRMRQADVILAKGQGNYEALQGRWPGIFHALKVKCPRVAEEIGLSLGSSVFCQITSSGTANG